MVALDGDTGGPGERKSDGGSWGGADTQRERYATGTDDGGHLADPSEAPLVFGVGRVAALALVAVVGVWSGNVVLALMVGVVAAIGTRSAAMLLLAGLVALVAVVRAEQGESSLAPDRIGPYAGWVRIIDDPQPFPSSTRVIVEVEGERFEAWVRGRVRQLRTQGWRGGEWVVVSGERVRLDSERAGRVAWQHVVGGFEIEWASDVDPGGPIAVASNRVRSAIERAGDQLPGHDGPLFRGLVVGDDRDQPREMIDRFRASGLSHLTAVSGQNVSFVLAAAGPLLRRLRPWWRWTLTLGLIVWFVTLTRFEPSIVRAGVMAGLSATAFVLGRERSSMRILAVAVLGLVLVDPLLVRSIGFWLSVGATAGVSGAGPWIAARLARFRALRLFALPLGVTLGAQLGVLVPSVLVFGRLPLVSIPANLLAVPVAGAVMLFGLPAGLLAGWVPPVAPWVMFPARFGTRWVDTVAMIGERIEPGRDAQIVGWVLITVVVVVLMVFSRNTADSHGDLPPDR